MNPALYYFVISVLSKPKPRGDEGWEIRMTFANTSLLAKEKSCLISTQGEVRSKMLIV